MKIVRTFWRLSLIFALACESGEAPPARHCGIDKQQAQHGCVHGTAGPFADLDGRLEAPIPLAAELHTLYTVTLSPKPDGSFGGHLRFSSRRPGLWALFFTPGTTLDGQRHNGAPLGVELFTELTNCASFSVAHVIRMAQDEAVTLRISKAPGATTKFLPERLGASWAAALETESCNSGPIDAADMVDASAVDMGAAPDVGTRDGATMEAATIEPALHPQTHTSAARAPARNPI